MPTTLSFERCSSPPLFPSPPTHSLPCPAPAPRLRAPPPPGRRRLAAPCAASRLVRARHGRRREKGIRARRGRGVFFSRGRLSHALSPPIHPHTAKAATGRMSSVLNFYTDDSPGLKLSPVRAKRERERGGGAGTRARRALLPSRPSALTRKLSLPLILLPGLRRHHVVRLHRLRDVHAHHRQGEVEEEEQGSSFSSSIGFLSPSNLGLPLSRRASRSHAQILGK
jgi:hypothetical protein